MGAAHTIEITIMPDGKVVGEVKGVTGPECAPLTKWLDELGSVTVDRKTGDFSKADTQHVTNKRQ